MNAPRPYQRPTLVKRERLSAITADTVAISALPVK